MKICRFTIQYTLLNKNSQTMHIAVDKSNPSPIIITFIPLFFQFLYYLEV